MKEKKNVLSVIALICAVISLAVSVFTFLSVREMANAYEERMSHNDLPGESRPTVPDEEEIPTGAAPAEASSHYCNLIVGDWSFYDAALTVDTAFAQVMAGPNVTIDDARKILTVNGEALYAAVLTLHPGEAGDSYELDLDKAEYLLLELSEGDHVELLLEATLSDGCVLTSCGAGWDYEGGQLLMIAG